MHGPHPSPPSSCWLTPAQWQLFLARRQRNNPGSSLSLHDLPDKLPARSLSMVQASLLKPTDEIRWQTGPERLSIMGFASDWMRPHCRGSSCRQRRCTASRGLDRPEAEGDLCVGLEDKQNEGGGGPLLFGCMSALAAVRILPRHWLHSLGGQPYLAVHCDQDRPVPFYVHRHCQTIWHQYSNYCLR
jgi:hypothetical protein